MDDDEVLGHPRGGDFLTAQHGDTGLGAGKCSDCFRSVVGPVLGQEAELERCPAGEAVEGLGACSGGWR
jgi:hypothetical protein